MPPQLPTNSSTHLVLCLELLMFDIIRQNAILAIADILLLNIALRRFESARSRSDIFPIHFLPRLEVIFRISKGDETESFRFEVRLFAHNAGFRKGGVLLECIR